MSAGAKPAARWHLGKNYGIRWWGRNIVSGGKMVLGPGDLCAAYSSDEAAHFQDADC